ncbi:unnamed protein product [Ascophyllum nodosum]
MISGTIVDNVGFIEGDQGTSTRQKLCAASAATSRHTIRQEQAGLLDRGENGSPHGGCVGSFGGQTPELQSYLFFRLVFLP